MARTHEITQEVSLEEPGAANPVERPSRIVDRRTGGGQERSGAGA
jgi:hypothetical protein